MNRNSPIRSLASLVLWAVIITALLLLFAVVAGCASPSVSTVTPGTSSVTHKHVETRPVTRTMRIETAPTPPPPAASTTTRTVRVRVVVPKEPQ